MFMYKKLNLNKECYSNCDTCTDGNLGDCLSCASGYSL